MDASAEHRVRDVPISFSADVAAAAPSSTRGAAPRFFETRRSYVALASSLHGTSVAEKGTARAPSASSKVSKNTRPFSSSNATRAPGGVADADARLVSRIVARRAVFFFRVFQAA